jgi:predicted phosphodiesterase
VLCTGNVVDGRGDVDKACALLVSRGVLVVRGNHDRWIREDAMRNVPHAHRMTDLATTSIELLKSLPPTATIDIPGGKLLLCHGVGTNDMRELGPMDGARSISSNDELLSVLFDATIAFMVGGHTHKPFVRRFERGTGSTPLLVVNPGTLVRDEEPGFLVLDVGARRVDFYRIGDDLRAAVASRALL